MQRWLTFPFSLAKFRPEHIFFVTTQLDTEGKEGQEILEAYNKTSLVLNGNGTHLAPWYARLGFQRTSAPGRVAFMPTMWSLTGDGGNVPVLDLVVEKVGPWIYQCACANERLLDEGASHSLY